MLLEIPNDQDPEFFCQNQIKQDKKEIKELRKQIEQQDEKIKTLYDPENKLYNKLQILLGENSGKKKDIKKMKTNQKNIRKKVNSILKQSSSIRKTTHSLTYINEELDKLYNIYYKQNEENKNNYRQTELYFSKLSPPAQPIELEAYQKNINLDISIKLESS